MSKEKVIRVGSRKSELAQIQTRHVISLLKEIHPEREFEIVTMSTLGDKILNIPLPKIGEKSLFTRELEIALSTGCVDFVVHSLKDLPTTLPEQMVIGAVLEREDPCDALVLHKDYCNYNLSTLPKDSVIGTSSLRRSAQLHRKYPHLKVVDIRGNLNTRLQKLDDQSNGYQAIILAVAGLYRMNWNSRISKVIDPDDLLYAVGQGALAVECRENDEATLELLKPIYDPRTAVRIIAERTFLRTLGGGCSAPVGIRTELKNTENNSMKLSITGGVWSLNGQDEVVENDSRDLDLIPENLCPECPYKKLKEGNSSSEKCCGSKDGDIECLQSCGTKNKCTFENSGNKCPYEPPNKKLKSSDKNDNVDNKNGNQNGNKSSTALSEVDPHEHCPVKLPIGADFMGKCPFLDNNFVGKCPVSGQILGKTFVHGTKCPFMKDGVLQTIHEDNKIENEQISESSHNHFCGLVRHPDVNVKIFEEAEKLGVSLAENLIAKGASNIMAKAQAYIRGN